MQVRVGSQSHDGTFPVIEIDTGRIIARSKTKSDAVAAARIRNYKWAEKKGK